MNLSNTESIKSVVDQYSEAVEALVLLPSPETDLEENAFAEQIENMLSNNTKVPRALAEAVQGTSPPPNARERALVDQAMARFFTARVGLRFLVEHYLSSRPGEFLVFFSRERGC